MGVSSFFIVIHPYATPWQLSGTPLWSFIEIVELDDAIFDKFPDKKCGPAETTLVKKLAITNKSIFFIHFP